MKLISEASKKNNYNDIKIVSKELAQEIQKIRNPLWEGYIESMPTNDREYMVISKVNKYRTSDFFEQFMYKINKI